jgi:hypothetical protein
MAGPAQVAFDDAAFQRALLAYSQVNRRDRATIVNAKTRDLMLRAARATPKGERPKIQALTTEYRLRNWLGVKAGATTRAGRMEASAKILRGRRSSVGFMRSGFVKAGRMIKAAIEARPGGEAVPATPGSHRNSRAQVSHAAAGDRPVASYAVHWASPARTAPGKDAMVHSAMARATAVVAADMMRYTERKMTQRGRALGLAVKSAGGAL